MRARTTSGRAGAAILIATLALMGGCGGGGDAAPADAAALPPAGPPPATGASAAESPAAALAAIGVSRQVASEDLGATLTALDRFGLPHDLFDAQLRDEGSGEGAAQPAEGAEVAPVAPVPGIGTPGDGALPPLAAPAPLSPIVPPAVIPVLAPPVVAPVPAAPVASAPTPAAPGAPATPAPVVPLRPGDAPEAPSEVDKRGLEAVFSLEGESLVAREGDLIPPERQELQVVKVAEGYVVLKLMSGLLPDGSDLVLIEVGESARLDDAQNGRGYAIELVDVREDQTP